MSIPPLVCCTPPPPDQCEEDKENDEFDLNYNMSHEDDDRNDYFCTFNVANSNTPTKNSQNLPPDTQSTESKSDPEPQIITHGSEIMNSTTIKGKVEIENIIEDLDLHFEQEVILLSPAPSENDTTESSPSCSSGIGMSFTESINPEADEKSKSDNFIEEDCISNDNEVVSIISKELNEIKNIPICASQDFESVFLNVATERKIDADEIMSTTLIQESVVNDGFEIDDEAVINQNDDFGDFDNFQFVPQTITDTANIDVAENPWSNNDSSENFGEFHANFDDVENHTESCNIENDTKVPSTDLNSNDDEFGDFNDFKTSSGETHDTSLCTDDPALNLDKRDESYMEKVEKILDSIFGEETTSCNEKFDKVLDSSLCETWGHLLQIEERQPYMVTWNNSVGQNTLLKSLCIDSRNILYAPKWGNSTMPRYAVNLGAPLQPLRQTSIPSNSHGDPSNEKQSQENWTDPFTNTGQEVTYAEALLLDLENLMATLDQMAHNHTSLKISDLLSHVTNNENCEETKESRVPKPSDVPQEKADRAYPTSLNIQPLRQINLPDTHIYTPTDSETPRSKTIHYDIDPHLQNTSKTDDSYSEFQDFKSTSENTPSNSSETNTSDPKIIPKVMHQTILQPVKVEIMPTLNWPDPGCVKETFDDFSDFVSNSSWFTNKGEAEANKDTTEPTPIADCTNNLQEITHTEVNQITPIKLQNNANGVKDEFDSFQSATAQQVSRSHSINSSKPLDDNSFQCIFPDINKKQDDVLSPTNIPVKLKEPEVSMNNDINLETLKIAENHYRVIGGAFQPQLLQPTPAVTTPKHNTTQILQPLSLESISQINWPNPGIDLQDLSRFNPVDKLHSLKNEASTSASKSGSPVHQVDDDWGDFVSSRPKQNVLVSKPPSNDDEEWSDFVSSPAVRPQNGLSTISLNVHTYSSIQKTNQSKQKFDGKPMDIPSLNYITPKTGYRAHSAHDPHFQNL